MESGRFTYNVEGGQYQHTGTLVITIGGQNAIKVSYWYMHIILAEPVGHKG